MFIVARYGERSVAEQNSLDLSWSVLMNDRYSKLREFLFPTKADLVRFRQLVVNSVMSTDLVSTSSKVLILIIRILVKVHLTLVGFINVGGQGNERTSQCSLGESL